MNKIATASLLQRLDKLFTYESSKPDFRSAQSLTITTKTPNRIQQENGHPWSNETSEKPVGMYWTPMNVWIGYGKTHIPEITIFFFKLKI